SPTVSSRVERRVSVRSRTIWLLEKLSLRACLSNQRRCSRLSLTVNVVIFDAYFLRAFPFGKIFPTHLIPLVALSSRVGSIRRQIAAARAITFTSVVNDSITTSPL